jgi:ABC-type enterochelin transport system substrate-binding protein
MKLILLLIASVSLLMTGCHTNSSAPTEAGSSQLHARLHAAKTMTVNADRDETLSTVAREAAKSGDVDVAKGALNAITDASVKNEAASDCAVQFSSAGRSAAANEVAGMISSVDVRDGTLKKLATRIY